VNRALRALAILVTCQCWQTIPDVLFAQQAAPVAQWSFDKNPGNTTRDSIAGISDRIEGYGDYVPGVSGTGLRFDGYTTGVVREGKDAPKLKSAFTAEAWVALNAYPWNFVPIVDHEADQQVGYFFGIDALGHVALQVSVERVWQTVTTTIQLPLKKWVYLAGVFDHNHGLTIFVDGKEAGHLAVKGEMSPLELAWYGQDSLLIGRVRQPALPVPSERDNPKYAVLYSLDGVLDEVRIYDRGLSVEEIDKHFHHENVLGGDVLPWPALPGGPGGPGRFGAYYTTLKYEDAWDKPRRIGPDSDVVVRFDQSPVRLIFWQGTNYIPAWVTENNKWYTDEFVETWGAGCPDGGDCEPMSDKQSRYSHVRILESNDARTIIHWRYALSEVENYKGANPDAMGWFDWADEYWTIYPDGIAIRKQVLRSSDLSKVREWQESIVINGAGQRPEDDINLDAITLANMQGETATYSWKLKTSRDFDFPTGPQAFPKPAHPNIQVVNLKSEWKPFEVVPPQHSSVEVYKGEKTFYTFECWNHWPLSQIVSSGRPCLTPDRASHSSLSHIFWDPYQTADGMQSKLLMTGLTKESISALLPIARAWLTPASLKVAGQAFRSDGYDPTQRAFVLSRQMATPESSLELTLDASQDTPVVNPAIVVKNWGVATPRLLLNENSAPWGKDYRYGFVPGLEGTDLIVWIRRQATQRLQLTLTPEK
jgi:hypothetical protein